MPNKRVVLLSQEVEFFSWDKVDESGRVRNGREREEEILLRVTFNFFFLRLTGFRRLGLYSGQHHLLRCREHFVERSYYKRAIRLRNPGRISFRAFDFFLSTDYFTCGLIFFGE
jgi:hypothetical protein